MNIRMKPLAACISLLAFHSAFAQTGNTLEPVVVTANRFDESRFASPIGSRVITAEEIYDSGAGNIAEALGRLGGVQLRQDLYGGANPGMDLRGFGVTGDQNTLILVDGVRISENELTAARLSGISLDAVEKIEILPSGGAVLYGSNATGGVINIITKKAASNSRHAKASLAYGSHETYDLRASGGIGGEMLSLNLNAQSYQTNNQRQNNRYEQQNAGGTLALRLPDTTLAFNFGGEQARARLPGNRSASQWQNDPNGASTPNDFANTNVWHAGLSANHRIGELEFAANLIRRERTTEFYNDYGGGWYNNDHRYVTTDEFSPRIKWNANLAGMASEMVAGFDWRNWDYQSFVSDPSGPSLETGTQKTSAWYLQETLQLTNTTQLSLGGRTENLRMERNVPYATYMAVVNQRDERNLHAWSAGLKQTLSKGWVAHVRTGTSYRIGNIDENRCWSAPCSLLHPQTSRDHEAGLSWTASSKLSGSAVLFRSELENEIYFNRLAGSSGSNINMPPTRRQGIELSSLWAPLSSLTLNVRYTYTEATFRSGAFSGVDVSGKAVPVVPRHRASLNATWAASELTKLYAGMIYTGSQQYDNDPANRYSRMPAYTTVDTKVSHRLDNLTLALAVNNVFDKKYYSYALVNSPTTPTNYNVYPDRSRTIMASLEYAFK